MMEHATLVYTMEWGQISTWDYLYAAIIEAFGKPFKITFVERRWRCNRRKVTENVRTKSPFPLNSGDRIFLSPGQHLAPSGISKGAGILVRYSWTLVPNGAANPDSPVDHRPPIRVSSFRKCGRICEASI